MERIKGRPATGHPTLFLLDEFAALKRMEVIENAAAQAAGFGVKFLFVVQNLPQIEDLYEKSWETFLGNSGLKLFFQIEDDFTRSYLARQLGELETTRQSRSGSQSQSLSDSHEREGANSVLHRWLLRRAAGRASTLRTSKQSSSGTSKGWSFSRSWGCSDSSTEVGAIPFISGPWLNPDEIGRMLARNDDRGRPGYPGIVLALIPGEHPLLARRVNYFESPHFLGLFDPHPNHPPPLTLAELAAQPRPTLHLPRPSFRWDRVDAFFRGIRPAIATLFALVFWGAIASGAYWVYQHRQTVFADSSPPGTVTGNAPAPKPASPPVTYGSAFTPPAPPSPPQNPAYDRGVADWRALQAWFTTQTGDRRAGADWWAAHRSHDPEPCDQAADDYSDNEQAVSMFEAGCTDAKRWLDPIDAKRADPQYKAGFNDEAKRDPL